MVKTTLCFSNPTRLSCHLGQLVIEQYDQGELKLRTSRPIEDIALLILDHPQISVTSGVFETVINEGGAVVTCNSHHIPTGLLMPLSGNTLQSERFQAQIESSLPLRKQMWQQTVAQKIRNQASVLYQTTDSETQCMLAWAAEVRSGDADNLEGRAAAYYWPRLWDGFVRRRDGDPPNNLLNYGYAVLRAIVARGLVASGLLPTLGIHHHNRYNAYCLADDIMEPYRPYVDLLVVDIVEKAKDITEITTQLKQQLLTLPQVPVSIGGSQTELLLAVSQTTATVAKCFMGESRKILYPEM